MISTAHQPALVIFDCDGTLIDSQHVIVAAMTYAFESRDRVAPSREDTLSIVGLSLFEAVHRLVPDEAPDVIRSIAEDYKAAFNRLRAETGDREPLYTGARETIERLGANERSLLGIATGKSRRGVDHFLEREKFNAQFATIQTADTARSKPDPDMIHQALGETGVDAGRAVMIGDTTYDMEMGHAAGVLTVGVSWGYHDVETLRQVGADHIVDTFDELTDLLQERFSFGLSGNV